MTLHEISKIIFHNNWKVAMNNLQDIYVFLEKLGASTPNKLDWDYVNSTVENYSILTKVDDYVVIEVIPEIWNLLYNLKVLEITEDFTVIVGYGRNHK